MGDGGDGRSPPQNTSRPPTEPSPPQVVMHWRQTWCRLLCHKLRSLQTKNINLLFSLEGSWICRRCWRGVQTTRFRNRYLASLKQVSKIYVHFRHLETRGCFRVEHMGGRGGRGFRRKRLGRQGERPRQRQQVNFISLFFFQSCVQQINI